MKEHDKDDHTLGNLFTAAYAGWLAISILRDCAPVTKFLAKWTWRIFLFSVAIYVGFDIIIKALENFPILTIGGTVIILAIYFTRKISTLYNKFVAKKEARELEERQRLKMNAALEFVFDWFQDTPMHMYTREKERFVQYLFDSNCMVAFHLQWDDAYRQHMIGKVIGKYNVCHLWYMTEDQKRQKREVAWNRHRDTQRQLQLKKNAEAKRRNLGVPDS